MPECCVELTEKHDRPKHCTQCGGFLRNSLSDNGLHWLRTKLSEFMEHKRSDIGLDRLYEYAEFYDMPIGTVEVDLGPVLDHKGEDRRKQQYFNKTNRSMIAHVEKAE